MSSSFIFFVSIWTGHNISYISMAVVFAIIYSANHPFFERYKINNNPWPWNEDPVKWEILKKRSYFYIGINNALIIPGYLLASLYFNPKIEITVSVEELPDMKKLIATIILCMMLEDLGFYVMHKLLH